MSKGHRKNYPNIAKVNDFESDLHRDLYKLCTEYERNDTESKNKDFITNLPSLIKTAAKKQWIADKETEYLRKCWGIYNKILNDASYPVKVKDIKNLAAYFANSWLNSEGNNELTQTLNSIHEKAINLQLGSFEHCNDILQEIAQGWTYTIDEQDIIRLAERKFIDIALIKYDRYKLDKNITKKIIDKLKGNIFFAACKTQDIYYLKDVVTKFQLDLTTLQIPVITEHDTNSQIAANAPTIITPTSILLCIRDEKFREQYAKFLFKEQRIHPDSDKDRQDFKETNCTTALMQACSFDDPKYFQDMQHVVALLIKYGSNVNLIIKNIYTGFPRTAVSFVIGNTNYKLLEYLEEQGADLRKALNLLDSIIEQKLGKPIPSNLKIVPISISPELTGAKFAIHWQKICLIIENFLLKQITSPAICAAEVTSTIVTTDDTPSEEKLTTEYINFKEQVHEAQQILCQEDKQETSDIPPYQDITTQFDLFFIKLIQKSATVTLQEEDFKEIHKLIEQHSELQCYALHSLLNEFKNKNIHDHADISLAHNIFEYQPQLLHKFCQQRKAICSSKIAEAKIEENDLKAFNNDIYQVNSHNLQHKVFITLSKDLKAELENRTDVWYQKVQKALSNCKFIAADSYNISGIKTYFNRGNEPIIKLKIAHGDPSLRASHQYIEEKTGNVLIILKEIQNHNKPIKPLLTTRCENFKDNPEIKDLYGRELDSDSVQDYADLVNPDINPNNCVDNLASFCHTAGEEYNSQLIGKEQMVET